jgi:lysozyme
MSEIIPTTAPRATRETVLAAVQSAWGFLPPEELLEEVFVVGVRGYRRDTMGKPGANDRGIYDDAFFVFGPGVFATFNGNTDPSIFRPGIATLKPGRHLYYRGWHKKGKPSGHLAYRPATKDEALPVLRDGVEAPRPGIAINIHRGGINSTSSEGCQTLHPKEWPAFDTLLSMLLVKHKQLTFPYYLIDGPIT